ncbi:MAG: FHA domain-containing protein [Betaproteobacteria bacterium]|nr:FHA domain-containing protein [Betaproteobacteria bacterium]
MARLILSMDGLVLKEIPLDKERMSIGRKAHNDIQIDNLAISGEHAAIVTILNDSFLEDLDSTNGTLVNGQRITKHALKNNDVIELVKYRLKYIADDVAGAQPGGEALRAARPAAPPQVRPPTFAEAQVTTPRPAPAPASMPQASIRIASGPLEGKVLELVKALTSLGKPGVQVAVVARRTEGVFLTHVEGGGYPTVNGVPIGSEPHPLKSGDMLEIAGVSMEVSIVP